MRATHDLNVTPSSSVSKFQAQCMPVLPVAGTHRRAPICVELKYKPAMEESLKQPTNIIRRI